MFEKKYIFETKTTRLRRLLRNSLAFFFLSLFVFILICIYIPISAKNLKSNAKEALFGHEPDIIAVLTGDKGRISYALNYAKKNPSSKLFISGIYANNSLKTILKSQTQNISVEEYLKSKAYQVELDYLSSNTIENVLSILNYLKKNKNLKKVLIISSDYHILRIKFILDKLNTNYETEFYFDSVSSDYTKYRSIKLLFKEVYKLIKASTFLLLWDQEDLTPSSY